MPLLSLPENVLIVFYKYQHRIDSISHYSESRELRPYIPFLTGMHQIIYQKQQFLTTVMFLPSYLREIADL